MAKDESNAESSAGTSDAVKAELVVSTAPFGNLICEGLALGDRLKFLDGIGKLIDFVNSEGFQKLLDAIQKIIAIFNPVATQQHNDSDIENAVQEVLASKKEAGVAVPQMDIAAIVEIIKLLWKLWATVKA